MLERTDPPRGVGIVIPTPTSNHLYTGPVTEMSTPVHDRAVNRPRPTDFRLNYPLFFLLGLGLDWARHSEIFVAVVVGFARMGMIAGRAPPSHQPSRNDPGLVKRELG